MTWHDGSLYCAYVDIFSSAAISFMSIWPFLGYYLHSWFVPATIILYYVLCLTLFLTILSFWHRGAHSIWSRLASKGGQWALVPSPYLIIRPASVVSRHHYSYSCCGFFPYTQSLDRGMRELGRIFQLFHSGAILTHFQNYSRLCAIVSSSLLHLIIPQKHLAALPMISFYFASHQFYRRAL
jgi:hypothetical protein